MDVNDTFPIRAVLNRVCVKLLQITPGPSASGRDCFLSTWQPIKSKEAGSQAQHFRTRALSKSQIEEPGCG